MSDLLSQQKVWNHRAINWQDHHYGEPLTPTQPELEFQRKQLALGGRALVLGATQGLCNLALEVSGSVTAVDFAPDSIEVLRMDGVQYVCQDWITFLENSTVQYDNIMSDGALPCLEFPGEWQRLSEAAHSSLRPGGIFAARAFLSTANPPKDHYDNPNLAGIVPAMARVDENWMLTLKARGEREPYDVRYAFPTREVLLQTFGKLALKDDFVPTYEEGDRFVTFALQRRDDE